MKLWQKAMVAGSVGIWLLIAWNWAWDFSQHALQMDLASFYAAGESMRLGLNPYLNNYPIAWTGADLYRWSAFLYSPLAAFLFQGFALLPYHILKTIWSFLSPFIVVVSGWVIWQWLRPSVDEARLAIGFSLFMLAAACAFPMKIEIERGQIDLILLLVTLVAIFLIEARNRSFWGGFLLGFLPIFKLHLAYLFPYLLLRRHFRALLGSIISLILWVSVQIIFFPTLTLEYVTEVIPRTSRYGNIPPPHERLNLPGMPQLEGWDSVVVNHGRVYLLEGFDNSLTASNASLVRPINARLGSSGLALISPMLWLVLSLVLIPVSIRSHSSDPKHALAFWLAGFGIMLLSAPLTWSMATVWLLPVAFLIPLTTEDFQRGRQRALPLVIVLALLLLGLDERPLRFVLLTLAPFLGRFVSLKYVLVEVILSIALVIYIRRELGAQLRSRTL